MKMKWILTVLLAVFVLDLIGDDEIREYQNALERLEETYIKALKADQELREKTKQERARRKDRIRRYSADDDDDDDDERDHRRSELRNLARQRRERQKTLLKLKKELEPHIIHHKAKANVLATRLREIGIRNSFAYYAKQVTNTYEVRGLDSDFEKEDFRLQKAYNPQELFVFISFDLNRLIADGIDITSNTPVPEKYQKYKLFLQFYEDLEFYREMTNGFKKAKNCSVTCRDEMRRRCKRMIKNAKKLDELLQKNNPEFAKKMDVIKLTHLLCRHLEQHVFGQSSFLEEFLQQHSDLYVATPAENSTNNFNKQFKEKIWVMDELAEYIRICEPGDKSKTKRKARRKARSKGKNEPEFAKFFANDPVIARNQQEKENDSEDSENEDAAPAEMRKIRAFVTELNRFREEYCGTIVVSSDGIAPEYIPVLKMTMTPAQQTLFDEAFNEQKAKGKDPEDCAAAGYYKVRANELKKQYLPTDAEMEKIRNAMKKIKNSDPGSPEKTEEKAPQPPPAQPQKQDPPQTTEDDWG